MTRTKRAGRRVAHLAVEGLERRLCLAVATINWSSVQQTIAGFGSSSAWNNIGSVDSSQQQLLWSITDGAGLSMLRSRIRPDTSSSSDEIPAMQKAQAMGVTIWSTPWSPPAAWKSNNNVDTIVNGVDTMGYLLSSHYQDYANWLKQYIINMANNGITIYAVSMQNEPNWSASYESARWSAQQFHDALSILHDTLAADSRTANVKIILPEEIHWNNLDLVSLVMSDPVESNYTNLIYADHTYGINTIAGGKDGFAPISGLNGHQIWETEHTGDDPGLGITAGLNEAQSIYDIVYVAQASAYHHWWTNAAGGAGLLGGNWQSTKLMSAMTQFSKFIRPGWVAVGESDDNNGLRISAFKNPVTGDFASVIVNTGTSAITETINLNGAYAPEITPWITTATLDVAQQQSIPAAGNGGSFTYTIPAQSIVTLTGTATATPVTEAPVGLMASATTTSTISLSWTNNLGSATGYTVQRSSDGATWTTLTSGLSSSTFSYTDSGLPANTLYYYRVQANNGTVFSNVDTAMTQPPAPTNLTASYNASNQNVTLNWTRNNSSVTDYAVDVSTDGGVTWTTQTAGISNSSSSYTDTAAPELATLQYRVRAVYGLDSSAPTNVSTVTTTVLKTPTGLSVTPGANSEVLKWTDNTTTNSTVSIERSTDNTNWTVIGSANHGAQTYTNSPVTEGATYYYRIRNYDSAVTPPTYSAYSASVSVTVPLATPTHAEVVFSPSPLLAKVLWDNNSTSDTAYEVDRSTDGGTTWNTLSTTLPANSTSYTDTTVTSGQAYEYRVTALGNGPASTAVTTLSETASALPAPYAHGDIGDAATVGLAGSASYDSATGTYTLTGAGADIWNAADGFQFAYTTLTGDSQLLARVTSVSNTNVWAKAGLMFRGGTAVDAAFADVVVTPGSGVSFQWRTTAGGSPNYSQISGITAPVWLKLVRVGNQFSGYYSTDNVNWTQIGGSVTISMGTTAYAGMVACSHTSSQLTTATFTNVALTGTVNQAPTVAIAAAASPSTVTGATANLSVLGADDAGEANLAYYWATTGAPPASVVFSSNGQNSSKNTLATFTKPGTYSLVVTVLDQVGLSTTSTLNVTVNQTLSGIGAPSPTMGVGTSQQLYLADQFGSPMTGNPAVTWLASAGSITAAGIYTAPPSPLASVTITAQSGGSTYKYYLAVADPLAWYQADTTGTTLVDSSGHGKTATMTGTLNTTYNFTSGIEGTALHLIAAGTPAVEYASLPSGIVSGLNDFTITAWVNIDTLNTWSRIFDFGTGTTANMFLTAQANGTGGPLRFAITTSGGGGEQRLDGPVLSAGTWYHVAVTLSGNTGTLYVNGAVAATNTNMTIHPASLGSTTQNYIGKSQYSDPGFQGSIDDFRIYSRALSASEVLALAKPTLIFAATPGVSPVTTTSTTLSVLGTDQTAGESALTYTWATTGSPPAPVVFSANGTNFAKNTTATFTAPGTYNFQVTILNPTTGSTLVTTTSATVNQMLTSIIVSPATVSLNESGTQQFTATALDQFGATLPSQPAFNWSATGGTVDSGGVYTAPFASGTLQVTATSAAVTGSATASITLLAGDINGDGQRTVADVSTLMTALMDMTAYQTGYGLTPNDAMTVGNLDGDSAITNLDVQAMIILLANAGGGASAPASASSATASFAATASAGTTSGSQVLSSDSIALRPLSAGTADQVLPTIFGQTSSASMIQSLPAGGTTIVLPTTEGSAAPNSEEERVNAPNAVILSHVDDIALPVTNARSQPLDADRPSVPHLATRNHLLNVLARDKIFLDWPSMTTP
jgi:O-glycosyl hydrolase